MSDMSPENEQFISQAVEAGVYPNLTAALDEAVELLRQRDSLRQAIRQGIKQAERGETLPAEQVFEHLEQRLSQIESHNASQS